MRARPKLQISLFEPFSELSRSELDLVAAHAHRVLIPGSRWLLRPGRGLHGHHYLVRGSVATVQPAGVVTAGQPAARKALYPGATGLRTLTDCEFLQVPAVVFELLEPPSEKALIVVGEAVDCWQSRFLDSELMTTLPPLIWQRLLSCLEPRSLSCGDWIIHEGEPMADSCFVLTAGSARVVRDGRTLTHLASGDLFGEDALITHEPRNASVRMDSDGQVMALAAADFRDFLVSTLLEGIYADKPMAVGSRCRALIRFSSSRDLRERIARLSRGREYLVSSGLPEVESLAIFLMRKRGLAAWAAP